MTALASRYHFTDEPFGFTVEGQGRPPVRVLAGPFAFEAVHLGDALPAAAARERFGLVNFGRLLDFVAAGLLRHWQPQEGWYGVRAWAQKQTARAIARRLREHWLRLLAQ